jgi:thioredoxin 1
MSIVHIEKQNYDELVKSGLVLVDFYAEWCGPCKMLAPALEALSNQREEIKIVKVDVDEQIDLARHFEIMSVPTMFLYKDGVIVSKKSGYHTLDMLNEWVNSIK